MTHAPLDDLDDVIAAFADGEAVDARALDLALADPDARAYLIDVLALRGLVGGGVAVGAIGSRAGHTSAQPAAWWSSRRWMSTAAALLVAGAAGGYAIGRVAPADSSDSGVAPAEIAAPALGLSAPAPTRVIELEPGKDWTERTGGN